MNPDTPLDFGEDGVNKAFSLSRNKIESLKPFNERSEENESFQKINTETILPILKFMWFIVICPNVSHDFIELLIERSCSGTFNSQNPHNFRNFPKWRSF